MKEKDREEEGQLNLPVTKIKPVTNPAAGLQEKKCFILVWVAVDLETLAQSG